MLWHRVLWLTPALAKSTIAMLEVDPNMEESASGGEPYLRSDSAATASRWSLARRPKRSS
jgi:hypothetical protein